MSKRKAGNFATPANSEKKRQRNSYWETRPKRGETSSSPYSDLQILSQATLVPNCQDFICSLCTNLIIKGEGVTLQDCLHDFCRRCLINAVETNNEPEIRCPYVGHPCLGVLSHREIRELVSVETFEKFLENSLRTAENGQGGRGEPNTESQFDELQELSKSPLVRNRESFDCAICMEETEPDEGVILKECLHNFCKACLIKLIETTQEAEVKCPFIEDEYTCPNYISQIEIKHLVDAKTFEKFLRNSLLIAEAQEPNSFHCRSKDCVGWCIPQLGIAKFYCQVCKKTNCVPCQEIHENRTCEQYQRDKNFDSESTSKIINSMIDTGIAIPCPQCKILIEKNQGCDGLNCTVCKVAICWATKNFRWGPKGPGDSSGGCGCTLRKRCHPNCRGCH